MKRILALVCVWLFTGMLCSNELDGRFLLLPQPQSVELISGKGIDYLELSYIQPLNDAPVPVLGEMLDRLPRSPRTGKSIRFQLTEKDTPASSEGYILKIDNDGVHISSKAVTGLFYGCQTLEQLMEDARDFKALIPTMKITDYPAISYRAVHFDSKHHLNRMEYYYREIDKLARYKVNAVIWELEDKLRYTRRPEIAASNAISKQEMQALCRYARERNVEISPLAQGLGHAGFILKHHWELRENPDSDWKFCPSDSRTYELQFDLYRDTIEAMPYGRYLHVGGDEITAIGIDERCKATGKTPFELQMIWLRKVCDFATAHGRIPIFWDDMPLKYGGVWNLVNGSESAKEVAAKWNNEKLDEGIGLFPKECIYMRWNYRDATVDDMEQEAFFFDAALVSAGRRNPAWGTTKFTLITLPDKNAPGQWNCA